MSAPYARKDADWTELDALIDAELDVVLSRHARPAAVGSVPVGSVPVDLATEEMLFLAQACEFLGRHADPSRLIAELAEKFAAPVSEATPPPAPNPQHNEGEAE